MTETDQTLTQTLTQELGPVRTEKALNAAVALHLGGSVAEAASEAGVTDQTVRDWRDSQWWPRMEALAEQETLRLLEAKARGVLLTKLEEGDGVSARWLLERRERNFAPATKRVEIEGKVDHRHERQQLEQLPTEVIERLADGGDDVIDAVFEEARPLKLSAPNEDED